MLFKEKKKEEIVKNPYSWPKSYYMEMEPAERRKILDRQLAEKSDGEIQKIAELFSCRYHKEKNGKYSDVFLKAWLELSMLGQTMYAPFSGKKNKKTAERAAQMLCLGREEEFGRSVLYDELGHLAGTYIASCLNDSKYQAVLFDIGKMKEEKVKEKIKGDLELISVVVPQTLEMEDTFALFQKAVIDMQERLL